MVGQVAQSVQIAWIPSVSDSKNPRNLDRLRYPGRAICEIEKGFPGNVAKALEFLSALLTNPNPACKVPLSLFETILSRGGAVW
jgi:hypothetical protein